MVEVVCVLRGGVYGAGEATEKEVSARSIKASKVVLFLLFYYLPNMCFFHRKVMYALFWGLSFDKPYFLFDQGKWLVRKVVLMRVFHNISHQTVFNCF